jgi:DNA-directed RNA polymerase beta' subunit
VYDLTIPSTLNFGLANGLQVRDTAQTGYIQRRLIKGLEDLKVEYDMTVRDNMGRIIQYAYGDDGIDTTRVENQTVPIVGMSIEDIYGHYDLTNTTKDIYTKDANRRMKSQAKETQEACMKYINQMIETRKVIVESVFKNKNEDMVKMPVSFANSISNIQGQLSLNANSIVDITPLEAFRLIEKYYAILNSITMVKPSKLFEVLYYYYLSPKNLLVVKRFHEKALTMLLEMIVLKYKQSIVHPGEMVGVIAGQSIGEPTTQMTLNSVTYETLIVVRDQNKNVETISIGDFTAREKERSLKVDYMENVDTTYAELRDFYEIPSCTEAGEIVWRRIEAVTKHPVVNKDGTNTMLKITTYEQREVVATKAKSFLKLMNGKVVPVDGDSLKVGDYIPVSLMPVEFKSNELDYNFGYLMGAYVAAGKCGKKYTTFPKYNAEYYQPISERYNTEMKGGKLLVDDTYVREITQQMCGTKNKFVSDKVIFSNKECQQGFLDAFVGMNGQISSRITMSSLSKRVLMDIQQMLNCLEIYSSIEGSKLIVSGDQNKKLASLLNLKLAYKQEKVSALASYNYRYDIHKNATVIPNEVDGVVVMEERTDDKYKTLLFDKIIGIEEVANTTDYAYDLTVEDTRTFVIYNGLAMMDTFHLAGVSSKSNVTRGVPRIEELLRLTSNPKNPSLTIHLKPLDETDMDKAVKYANMLEYTKLSDLVKSIQICFDPNERSTFLDDDKQLLEQFYAFEDLLTECNGGTQDEQTRNKSKWIIRMEMDAESLLDKNITMDDVHYAIANSAYGENVSCVFSDYNNEKLVFRIRVFDINKKKKIVANTLDQSDEIYALKNMQDVILNNIVLRGLININKASPRKLQNMVALEDGKYTRKDVWILDTTGSNLLSVLGLDYIDVARTYSNDVREVYNVLGIEAARQMLFNEITEVMEFSDAYINYHHLSLLCDRMTVSKNMAPIFRSGILNDKIGPIAKATFEVHTEVLLNAARHAQFDSMRGVSASVMCGQYGKYGTGAFNVILDMKEMAKLSDAVARPTSNIETMFGAKDKSGDGCSANTIRIRNNITNIKTHDATICDDDYDMGL